MQIQRTSGWVTTGLAAILGFIPGCSKDQVTRDDNKPSVDSLQADNKKLKERVEYLEDTDFLDAYAGQLEVENQNQYNTILRLEARLRGKETRLTENELEIANKTNEIARLTHPEEEVAWIRQKRSVETQKADLVKKLEQVYISRLDGNYPLDKLIDFFEKKKIHFDRTKIVAAWNNMHDREKEIISLSYTGGDDFYKAIVASGREDDYLAFVRTGKITSSGVTMSETDIKKIEDSLGLGFGHVRTYKDPLSVAIYACFSNAPIKK